MALPKLATPTYELEIPSSKDKLTYRPFLVKEEKILLLANESEEESETINALFDLEYIFLRIRAKSVGEIVSLKLLCSDDNETYADVSLDLEEVNVDFPVNHTNKIELTDTVGILMRYPKFSLVKLSTDGSETEYIFKMIKECIDQIYDGDMIHERTDFNEQELDEFLESLSSEHFKLLQEFFETMPKLKHEVKFKNPKTKKQNKMTLEGMQSFFE